MDQTRQYKAVHAPTAASAEVYRQRGLAQERRDVLIEIGIASEIDIGSIAETFDNDPDPDPDPDFDFDISSEAVPQTDETWLSASKRQNGSLSLS